MASKKPKTRDPEAKRIIDYAQLPANLYEIAGDFGGVAWVTEKPLPRPESTGFFSEIFPHGVGNDD